MRQLLVSIAFVSLAYVLGRWRGRVETIERSKRGEWL